MIILKCRGIFWCASVRDTVRRNVSHHGRARKVLYPDKWRKLVSKDGQLGIITLLQKYGKLVDGKKNIDNRAGFKAWKIKVECRRCVAVVSPCLSGIPDKWAKRKGKCTKRNMYERWGCYKFQFVNDETKKIQKFF